MALLWLAATVWLPQQLLLLPAPFRSSYERELSAGLTGLGLQRTSSCGWLMDFCLAWRNSLVALVSLVLVIGGLGVGCYGGGADLCTRYYGCGMLCVGRRGSGLRAHMEGRLNSEEPRPGSALRLPAPL